MMSMAEARGTIIGRWPQLQPLGPGMRGLDGFNFLVAMMGTGFGAFLPAYLAAQGWSEVKIGTVLTAATIGSMASQVPAGLLVDATTRRRLLLGLALGSMAASAIVIAAFPHYVPVLGALLLNAATVTVIAPAIAALSMMLVGHAALSERLGRNARYAAIGGVAGAAVMGTCSSYVSNASVFVIVAILALPAIWSLRFLEHPEAGPRPAMEGHLPEHTDEPQHPLRLLRNLRVLTFAFALLLFQMSNAGMTPVIVAQLEQHDVSRTGLAVAGIIMVPQFIVALASPAVGRAAQRIGRRPLLLVAFASLPMRAALFAMLPADNPVPVLLVEPLEGVGAAVIGVMLPLVAADLTRGTGCYNALIGVLGLANGIGAAFSTSIAGAMATPFGVATAFWTLAAIGLVGLVVLAALLPETRPAPASVNEPDRRGRRSEALSKEAEPSSEDPK